MIPNFKTMVKGCSLMIFPSSVFTFGKMKLANIYLFKVKH